MKRFPRATPSRSALRAGARARPDNDEKYRLKFLLSDGRFIYATDKAVTQFVVLDKAGLVTDPTLERVFRFGAYTTDLKSLIGRKNAKAPFLTIVDTLPEEVESAIDSTAFVLGGISVGDFVAQHGNCFQA